MFSIFKGRNILYSSVPATLPTDDEVQSEKIIRFAESPMDTASHYSIITYSWMNELIKLGAKQTLNFDDIYPLPKMFTAASLSDRIHKAWAAEIESSKKRNKKPSLAVALLKEFGQNVVFSIVAMLPYIVGSLLQPLFVGHFLEYVQSKQTEFLSISNGYGLVFLLSGISLVSVVSFNYSFYHTSRLGIYARSASIIMTFNKSLRLSSASKGKHTTGEIISLISNDAERLWQGILFANWLWVGPVLVIIAMVLIGLEVGYSAIAAIGTMFIINYLQAIASRQVGFARRKLVKVTDERVKLMNETLQGIRIVKFYAWEVPMEERIQNIRKQEVALIRQYQLCKMFTTTLMFLGPLLVTFALFVCYYCTGGTLTVSKIYTVYALLNLLRLPFALTPQAYAALMEASVSIDRLGNFLLLEELEDIPRIQQGDDLTSSTLDIDPSLAIEIKEADFYWESKSAVDSKEENVIPCLKNINLSIKKGEFVAVVGTVGQGKSSLLSAILGEMYRSKGSQYLNGNVAYVGQEHWIQNLRLLENVIFNDNFDDLRYSDAVDSAQLSNDLLNLPHGDSTSIGERGINLSGGQKARVNLSRALFKSEKADIYLIDDCLASLDVHVGKAVFDEAITGMLEDKTRVVVLSSSYHLLQRFDRIIVMSNGEIVSCGTYDQIIEAYPLYNANSISETTISPSSSMSDMKLDPKATTIQDIQITEKAATVPKVPSNLQLSTTVKYDKSFRRENSIYRQHESKIKQMRTKGNDLIQSEDRETGAVHFSTYFKYFSASVHSRSERYQLLYGFATYGFLLLAFATCQLFRTVSDIWLGIWAVQESGSGSNTYGRTNSFYFYGYIVLVGSTTIMALARSWSYVEMALLSSKQIHLSILKGVFDAPINLYFDVTPLGRILNRFSRDLDSLDSILPDFFLQNLQNIFQVLFIIIVCISSSAFFVIILIPIAVLFYYVQSYFRKSSREIKRLDSISRSPVYSQFGEVLNGLQTIRAYGLQILFKSRYFNLVDLQNRNFFSFWMASRWLALRLDIIGVMIIFVVTLLAVSLTNASGTTVNPNYLGLALTYSLQLTGLLQWTVRVTIETESNMTSVERLLVFGEIIGENKNDIISDEALKEAYLMQQKENLFPNSNENESDVWPFKGHLVVSNLQLRYRPELDLVLRGVNFSVPGGSKLGVVGRTAAGKSSLMLALFRIVEPEEGSLISIDGTDIMSMNLHQLRSHITIIPQDPVMFSGTLRSNLDPFKMYTDDEVWQALERSHMKDEILLKFPKKLEHEISERGENISVGQRQLICIARALLRKPKVLVLDEATASVDSITDAKIQETVRNEFKSCTVLTIAHRLETIADYDMVIVMDHGAVAEAGEPYKLLNKENGMFKSLIDELGNERKENFINIAKSRYFST